MNPLEQLTFVKKSVQELKEAPYNPREIDSDALSGLEASITRFGLVEPIIWNQKTGFVVGGHQRLKVLEKNDIKETTVIVVNLDPTEEKALNITLNNQAIQGNWTSKLAEILMDLRSSLPSEDFLSLKIASLQDNIPEIEEEDLKEGNTDPDDIPEAPEYQISQPGTLWQLGPHRLFCGDSTDRNDLAKLLGNDRLNLIWTDPPYNVDYKGHRRERKGIKNDAMSDDSFIEFLTKVFSTANEFLSPGTPFYVAHSSSTAPEFRYAIGAACLDIKQTLIWVKHQFVISRQDYNNQYEPIFYGWKPGSAHSWFGEFDKTSVIDDEQDLKSLNQKQLIELVNELRNQRNTDVIREPRPLSNDLHPTMKPVALIRHMIRNSTQPTDIVLDLFGGSGSTLMACEQLNRQARLIELDLTFCDVIVKRWEEFTGEKAVAHHAE